MDYFLQYPGTASLKLDIQQFLAVYRDIFDIRTDKQRGKGQTMRGKGWKWGRGDIKVMWKVDGEEALGGAYMFYFTDIILGNLLGVNWHYLESVLKFFRASIVVVIC